MRTTNTRPSKQRSRKRAKARFRLFLALCAGSLALLISILMLVPIAFGEEGTPDKPAALGIKTITVTGNTRYAESDLLTVCDLHVGRSAFSINRRKVANTLKDTFPYIQDVSVKVDLRRTLTLTITEEQVLGTVYAGGYWVTVSQDGIGLEKAELRSERPLRGLYIKGAAVQSDVLGEPVLTADSLSLATAVYTAAKAAGLTDISMIDIGNRADIRVVWKNQITMLVGSDTNLNYTMAAAASALPRILELHGATVSGRLNLTQYSDPTIESPSIVFTPSSML